MKLISQVENEHNSRNTLELSLPVEKSERETKVDVFDYLATFKPKIPAPTTL